MEHYYYTTIAEFRIGGKTVRTERLTYSCSASAVVARSEVEERLARKGGRLLAFRPATAADEERLADTVPEEIRNADRRAWELRSHVHGLRMGL